MRRSGGGLEAGPIPLHRPFSKLAGWEWAQTAEDRSRTGRERRRVPPGPSIRQMDQAFRRDSRRYDGGFFLY